VTSDKLRSYVVCCAEKGTLLPPQPDPETGMLRNYLIGGSDNQDNRTVEWFGDGAGSSALVTAALRLAVLEPAKASALVKQVEPLRQAILANINATGFINPTVDPLDWYTEKPFYKGE
jgi:hypothetical protein